MSRAFLIVLDSVGIGGAPDAADFGDAGANTVGHIAQTVDVSLPNLDALGLGAAVTLASGLEVPGLGAKPTGAWGAATEVSRGKDTPSGHWELAGVPVPWEWTYFPDTRPAFDAELSARVAELAGTDGILGNRHASGTAILMKRGPRTCGRAGRSAIPRLTACSRSQPMKRYSDWTACWTYAPRWPRNCMRARWAG